MGGLREKKKMETQARILGVSKEIFLKKGYSETTMDEIASKANIGVGTLYNYFKSKAEIFIAIMSEDMFIGERDYLRFEDELGQDVSNIVMDFIWKSLKNLNLFSKKIWKELIAAVLHNAKSTPLVFKGMVSYDYKFIENLEQLFHQLLERGMLMKEFDSSEGAYAVYSILVTQFMLYVYTEETTTDMLRDRIEHQVRFLLGGKLCL